MELGDDEIVRLYNLFRNLKLAGKDSCKYADCGLDDAIWNNLKLKVKHHIDEKGQEWMRAKNIKKWW